MNLHVWLKVNGVRAQDFGDQVGETRQSIYRFAQRKRIPKLPAMREIVRVTRGEVMPNDFYDLSGVLPEPAPPTMALVAIPIDQLEACLAQTPGAAEIKAGD